MDEKLTLITAEILSEYFESKDISPRCSLCGHIHFTVPQVGAVIFSQLLPAIPKIIDIFVK
ncbi:hypothetical protein WDV76_03035 [Xenorhabdus griffiniae]|uniref:hypothetical protein n=1 Tax=Xenorhabdus griffiniae TaxID=351672 RepID=UPI0030D56D02